MHLNLSLERANKGLTGTIDKKSRISFKKFTSNIYKWKKSTILKQITVEILRNKKNGTPIS